MMDAMNDHQPAAVRRSVTALAAGLVAVLLAGPVLSGGEAADPPMVKGKAINTICPVTGKAVEAKLTPVVVVIGKGEKAKRYVIGIAVASAADTIKGDPQKYADAAKVNKKAE